MRLPRTRPRSLAGQLFAMQVVLIAAVVAGCAVFAYVSGSAQAEETAARQVRVAALAVADSPSVREAIRTPDPSAALQPYAERVREDTGIAFITIMDTERVRWTHPDTAQIGDTFLGNTAKALRGQTFTETYTGTLGPSIRVVTPIRDNGRIVGLVSAGITVDRVSSQVRDQLGALALAAGGALALGGIGTYVVNARLRRHTHGMNAAELSRLHDYHQATLHAVREGLLMLDGRRRIALINDAGRELLGLEPDAEAVGRTVDELALPAPLTGALLASEARVDELHLTAERVVVVNTRPVVGGERRGTVVTLRDHTELQALSGELDSERGFTQALRSQAHEAANRLHTVVSLIELGRVEEAVDFATAELELAQVLTDRVVGAVEEPVLAALLLGKAAQANERGVELVLAEDSLIDDGALPPSLAQRDLVTILGNLIDNAVEAASDGTDDGSGAAPSPRAAGGQAGRARVTVTALADERELLLRVADTGAGIGPEEADEVFRRGWSTHGAGRGLGLALVRQAAYRNGGTVELDPGPDGGARFTVRLPLPARTAGSRPGSGAGSTPPSTPGTTPASAHASKEVTA
ncbi:sensor histidine kinase [Streptomyces sp. WAC00303]|uniref:sensor histidine kinase n=1 Tax=Streptomyces sp. WAC00303 TaxID=2933779 RepID=UPI00205B9B2D|nr:sensor histidine kinase [Streptomyces sp. WAC00303]UPT44769.1 sensor histidine kinase [Streptomyces sp. WAC00303]